METTLFLNANTLSSDDNAISIENRSFLYGEATFTTLRTFKGKFFAIGMHLERLVAGWNYLYPAFSEKEELSNRIGNLLKKCMQNRRESDGDLYVRVTLFHDELGARHPLENRMPKILLICRLVNIKRHSLYVGCKVTNFIHDRPDLVKMPQYAERFRDLRLAPQLDSIIYLTSCGRVLDATTSNLFIVKRNVVSTPSTNYKGILNGVTRRGVISSLQNSTIFTVQERELRYADLQAADEIFLTNSVQGVIWVDKWLNQTGDDFNLPQDRTKQISEIFSAYIASKLEEL